MLHRRVFYTPRLPKPHEGESESGEQFENARGLNREIWEKLEWGDFAAKTAENSKKRDFFTTDGPDWGDGNLKTFHRSKRR